MTIDLSTPLEEELRRMAGLSGMDVETLVVEAVRQYLDSVAITDLSPGDIATTQTSLLGELERMPPWLEEQEPSDDAAS